MNLSISNIAWNHENEDTITKYISENCFSGIEIAPTKISDKPFENIDIANEYLNDLKRKYKIDVCSIQSIWYGIDKKIFRSLEERDYLIEYTKKIIDYSFQIGCRNIVFGCPKNRSKDILYSENNSISFFKEIGDYACANSVYISLEPNPEIYKTDFLNTTFETIEFVKKVKSKGLKLNLDIGTIVENKENIFEICNNVELINHVHISEPFLLPIKERKIHKDLRDILENENYTGFISLEMKTNDINELKKSIDYVKKIFK